MQRSVFLAKLIGPPFLAIALGLFLKSEYLLGDDRRDDPAPEPDRQYADLPLWSVVTARWSRHRERPSFVDPRLARDHHHNRVAHGDRWHRTHCFAGYWLKSWLRAVRITNNLAHCCHHLAGARRLSQLQGILDRNLRGPRRRDHCGFEDRRRLPSISTPAPA